MRSDILAVLSPLSLAICAAICTTWIPSCGRRAASYVHVIGPRTQHWISAEISMNGVVFGTTTVRYGKPCPSGSRFRWNCNELNLIRLYENNLSVNPTFRPRRPSVRLAERKLRLPLWGLATITALLRAIRLWRYIRRGFPIGCCRVCGYDLRATPERCPECGTETNGAESRDEVPRISCERIIRIFARRDRVPDVERSARGRQPRPDCKKTGPGLSRIVFVWRRL